jgi:hypothetical protein
METAVEEDVIRFVDALLKKYNPCQKEGNKCVAGSPIPCCNRTLYKRDDPKDVRCLYIGESGCTHPNLHCKIWLCKTAMRTMDPEVLKVFFLIESIAKVFGLTKRPYLGQPYVHHQIF